MDEEKTVFIKVKENTRERLKAMGKKGESYDNVISRIFADGVIGDGGANNE